MELHPDLLHVETLLGSWTGHGHGEYPTIDSFDYVETITFDHVGKPFLAYGQRTRKLLGGGELGGPLHAETGYWRFPSAGIVEIAISHPTGITEVEEGRIEMSDGTIRMDLKASGLALTDSAKSVTQIERTFVVVGDELTYSVRMAAVGEPLQHHLSATLTRSAQG